MTAVTLPRPGASLLTDADRQLIAMVAGGLTVTQIGDRLGESEQAVTKRLRDLRATTCTRNNRHLVNTAKRNGWIDCETAAAPAEPPTAPPVDHGTLTGYVHRKCRCDQCTEAARTYANRSNRLRAYGQWQPYVDAQPVRDHIAMLARHGIGWQRACRLAGVPTGSVSKLLYGTPTRPPSRRVRPETANRLLALRPSLDLLADDALTDATGTRRRIQALVTRGFTQQYLAARLGADRANFRKPLVTPRVRARTARGVARLYDELWDADPAAFGISARDSRYARTIAEQNGWAPPAAWDDDTIDDPAAQPDLGANARRQAALVEDAEFIARTTGVGPDLIAARLGISRDYLDAVHRRSRELVAA